MPHTDDGKERIRAFQKGRPKSPATRARMAEAARLRKAHLSMHTPEARAKSAAKNKGRLPWNTGLSLSDEVKKVLSAANKGKSKSLDERIRMAEARKGSKSHFWKGGIHKSNQDERAKAMRSLKYREWRRQVFERDQTTCQHANSECSGRLEADHIKGWKDYPELRYQVDNGRSLCQFHHRQTPNYAGRRHGVSSAPRVGLEKEVVA